MARRQWTFVVVSDDHTAVRQYRFSRRAVQASIAAVLLFAAALSSIGTSLVLRGTRALEEHRLARANALLADELEWLGERVDTLRVVLGGLEQRDDYYRLLAGLEPLDADVRGVGIGGPDPGLQASPLLAFDGRLAARAHEASTELGLLIRRARLLSFSWREASDTLQHKIAKLESTPSILPARGYVSSGFSTARWHPILSRPRPHLGLDIVAPEGTPFVAAARGRVRFVGQQGEYGLTVEIDHGYGYVTRYAHASRALVRVGQPVERGDVIGHVGSTGLAVGPHLHYEVLVDGRQINPRRFIFEADFAPE
jgi:murein DD-endopeptidase MepM/ murein hydrolase activator NlpD